MKTLTISILALLLITLFSCKPSLDKDAAIEIPQVISVFQQSMLDEINLVRTGPAAYADLRLKTEMLNSFDNGSYLYLKSLAPIPALIFKNSLNLAATNYAKFLAVNNLMGHDEDGNPLKRAIIQGFDGCSIGENIAASTLDECNSELDPKIAAINFVKLMIIDRGVSDLGHRLTLLNASSTTVGIGYGRNPLSTFINYNVQDFGAH